MLNSIPSGVKMTSQQWIVRTSSILMNAAYARRQTHPNLNSVKEVGKMNDSTILNSISGVIGSFFILGFTTILFHPSLVILISSLFATVSTPASLWIQATASTAAPTVAWDPVLSPTYCRYKVKRAVSTGNPVS